MEPGGVPRHEIYHDVLAPAIVSWRRRHEMQHEARRLAARAREEARRRWLRRLRRAVLVIGSVVIAVITVVGFIAWQQNREARKQSRIATSRELAATSRVALYTDPELGILLAEEALRRGRTDEAVGALRAGLAADRSLGVLSPGRRAARGIDATADGKRLLAFGDDGHVRVWRVAGRKRLLDVPASASAVTDARFSPDGRRFVSAGGDGRIVVWDAEDGRLLVTLRPRGPAAIRAQWRPDGRGVLASTAHDVTVWNPTTGRRLQTLRSPRGAITTARWQPHTRAHVLTAGEDGIVRLWDVPSGTVVASLDGGSPVTDAVFDDRGTAVVTTPVSGGATVWSPDTGRTLTLRAPPYRGQVLDAAFDHSGARVATSATTESSVRIWDTRTGAIEAILTGHASHVTAIGFSPDDSTVATGSIDRSVRTWNAMTGDELNVLLGHQWPVSGLSFPRDDLIESADSGGDVRLWRTGVKELADLQTRHTVDTISFSHDGALVVAATEGGGVELLPWQRGRTRRPVAIPVRGGISTASLSHDGRLVVVAGARPGRPSAPARVIHVPDGRTVGRPLAAGPENGAVTATFSPDGRMILTGHRDGAARLWSSRSHRLLRRLGPARYAIGARHAPRRPVQRRRPARGDGRRDRRRADLRHRERTTAAVVLGGARAVRRSRALRGRVPAPRRPARDGRNGRAHAPVERQDRRGAAAATRGHSHRRGVQPRGGRPRDRELRRHRPGVGCADRPAARRP